MSVCPIIDNVNFGNLIKVMLCWPDFSTVKLLFFLSAAIKTYFVGNTLTVCAQIL